MLNVHPSLIPRWRGAAPIERVLMAGEGRTGVTIMRVTAGLDSGPVALAEEVRDQARRRLRVAVGSARVDGRGGGRASPGRPRRREIWSSPSRTTPTRPTPRRSRPRSGDSIPSRPVEELAAAGAGADAARRRIPGARGRDRLGVARRRPRHRQGPDGSSEPGEIVATDDELWLVGSDGVLAARGRPTAREEADERGGFPARSPPPRQRPPEPLATLVTWPNEPKAAWETRPRQRRPSEGALQRPNCPGCGEPWLRPAQLPGRFVCVYCLRRFELVSQCPNCGEHQTISRMSRTEDMMCQQLRPLDARSI